MSTDNLSEAISRLEEEEQRIRKALEILREARAFRDGGAPLPSRRGRKSMGDKERQEVSRRMKKYWASRRKARALRTEAVA